MNNAPYIIILLINCIISAFSQVLLKKSSKMQYKSFIYEYLNIKVIVSYSIFVFVLMVNSWVLRYLPLVILAPIGEAFPFVLSVFAGVFFFNERITKKKIIGILLITCGIVFIAS